MLHTSNTFVSYNHALSEADVVFLGIPFSSSFGAGRFGPIIIRESLDKVTGIEFGEKTKEGIVDVFSRLKVCDIGNVEIVPASYELTSKRIIDTINEIKKQNERAFILTIGGDHIISLSLAEALKPKTIIHLDAHSDSLSEIGGNMYSNQTWAYHASKTSRIIQLGINTWNSSEERENIIEMDISELRANIKEVEKPIHLSVDMDVFDPSYVDTSFPEGRMKPEEAFEIMNIISPYLSSMDIVEIDDNKLPSKTGFLAAQLIKKVLSRC